MKSAALPPSIQQVAASAAADLAKFNVLPAGVETEYLEQGRYDIIEQLETLRRTAGVLLNTIDSIERSVLSNNFLTSPSDGLLLRALCHREGVNPDLVLSGNRTTAVVKARWSVMRHLRDRGWTVQRIALALNLKCHGSVLFALKHPPTA